jgi:ABC-type Fe3+/spermidine/putrescine transport system ATPase subunit
MNLQEAIRDIQRELGVTTIFVTHDLGEAMAMSYRMALLLNGEIVALDRPENLFHRPRNLAAAKFMGVSTFLNGDQVWSQKEAGDESCKKLYAIRPEHILVQKRHRNFRRRRSERLHLSRGVCGISSRCK